MDEKNILFRIRDLKKYFQLKKHYPFQREVRQIRANENINLDIYEGEILGIAGESGCGKSTFGRTILQLYKPTEGTVEYFGDPSTGGEPVQLQTLSVDQMRKYRKDMQLIVQNPCSSLNPHMTVRQILTEGLKAHNMLDRDPKINQKYVLSVMERCGLASHCMHCYPQQFSLEQRQRISIARSVALHPKFIIADEPVSALDVSIQNQIINLLLDLKRDCGLTYMFISHDLSVIKHISDRTGVMYLGEMVELAKTVDLYASAVHPYTEALLSAIPATDVEHRHKIRILEGDIPSPIHPPPGCKFHTRCRYATEICKETAPTLIEHRPNHFAACHHPLKQREHVF